MWPNTQFPADKVTFTGEVLNTKLHFLSSAAKKLVTHKGSVLSAYNFCKYTGLDYILWASNKK